MDRRSSRITGGVMGSCGLRRSVQSVAIGVVLLESYSVLRDRETLGKSTSVCTFSRIYNFWDSNSDTGSASAALGRVPPFDGRTFLEKLRVGTSYGRTFFGKASGRCTDGCLIIDLFGSESFSKALFTVGSGRNDVHAGLISMNEEQVKADVPRILDQFSIALEKLYKLGARAFWIHSTGPIGCLPYFIFGHTAKPNSTDSNGCIKSYIEVAQEFNKQLKDKMINLRSQLQDAMLIYVDIYSVKYSWISDGKNNGFPDPIGCLQGNVQWNLSIWGIPAVTYWSTYLGIAYITQKQQTNGYCIVFWMARFPNPKCS